MSTTVRISLNQKLIEILDLLHQEYPTLEDAEIFKLALSNLVQTKIGYKKQSKRSNMLNFLDSYQKTKIQISNTAKSYTNFKDYQKQTYKYE